DDAFTTYGRGIALVALGDLASARDQLERACESVPNEPTLMTALADVLAAQGEDDRAAALYRSATEHPLKLSFAWAGWGRLLARQGDFDGACVKFAAGAAVDPHDPALYRAWADVLDRMGRGVDARDRRRIADETERRNAEPTDARIARQALDLHEAAR